MSNFESLSQPNNLDKNSNEVQVSIDTDKKLEVEPTPEESEKLKAEEVPEQDAEQQIELSPEEQLKKLEGDMEDQQQEMVRLSESIDAIKSAIKSVRENLGLPLTGEDPPSIFTEKDKLEKLKAEKETLEKQKECLISQQEEEKKNENQKDEIEQEELVYEENILTNDKKLGANSTQENIPRPKVEVESGFTDFIPQKFINDPAGYFEREGKNIKTGEIKYDETGRVREDPTTMKDFPVWKNKEGEEIQTVGRRVNTTKGAVGESGDSFYEYKILEQLNKMGLPAAKPVAKAEQEGTHIIVMERIPGLRWSERDSLNLKDKGYSDEDIATLIRKAEEKMNELKDQFNKAGVIRGWKLKDMVF